MTNTINESEDISIYGYTTSTLPHASIRAKERYNLELSKDDLKNISSICQSTK